ncbi:hypothetical protein ACXHXG_25350 [Rhizobium sp. LEGMi198b]|uniref:hypothetical protein n=1 Tax=unclassified Rhizobium TaxID=2613769 RepID=UPI000CDF4F56|nr:MULTISPECIES: hypothetical protein [Rhizobium]AVA24737.1 hypothetical protein NXC24_PC00290 [Rhizobium sp. NXC24]MDK4740342.1 hypothetical protein [Rhizobium sp. CNPSo 3464]UWU24640.1 hypothetical protein N2601_21060 [Rhizobium tropici]WFU05615.1 hypothetical protein QA648_20780 [Rhizobium sp. CB3171]
MNADMIAAWAAQNGFHSLDSSNFRWHDEARTITIEIKRLSVVLIDERPGSRPRLISRLFKDMRSASESGRFERLLLDGYLPKAL